MTAMGRWEKSFGYFGWHYAAGCVLDVFKENCRKEHDGVATKAKADIWAINDDFRQQTHRRARDFWCARTGLEPTFFPLSVDAVARLYFRIRKRRAEEVQSFEMEIEEASNKDSRDLFDVGDD